MMPDSARLTLPFIEPLPDCVTDYDVAMGYELFLGRSPENSLVIDSHKKRRFDGMINAFVQSGEFLLSTYQPLLEGQPVKRLDYTKSPSRNQISWLTGYILLDEVAQEALYKAKSWNEFFATFLDLGGAQIPVENAPTPSETFINAAADPASVSINPLPSQQRSQHDLIVGILDKLAEVDRLNQDIKILLRDL